MSVRENNFPLREYLHLISIFYDGLDWMDQQNPMSEGTVPNSCLLWYGFYGWLSFLIPITLQSILFFFYV